ncbi:MAG: gliding motility-associated C-terminal domain-containing protein [Saprospiraceae bacterium]|nr:gliding motility-associated C-terminal domain-containing protein [Saprospiraceae bacterium]
MSLGPDVTVCNNATFSLNPNANPNANYTWTGPAGLSCYNCPSPVVSGLTTGVYTFIGTAQTAQCTKKDTIKITVINGQQPQYNIIDDKSVCAGTQVSLGGAAFPNTFYQWSSAPPGFLSSQSNPTLTPVATTRYFIIAFSPSCPYASIDSVLITVITPPVLNLRSDTSICNGESILLGNSIQESGVNYKWTPQNGTLSNDTIPNPIATPLQTTVYKLVATKSICMSMKTVQISVVNLDLSFNVGDTVHICKGASVDVEATLNPPVNLISWTPLDGLQVLGNGLNVVANPTSSTLYTATAVVPGCTRIKNLYIAVDSLPANLAIHPSDTTICPGETVLLSSAIYNPLAYPGIEFQWLPAQGQDSLLELLVKPDETTTYLRTTTNGVCLDSALATVHVVTLPQLSVVPSDTMICIGSNVSLNLTNLLGVSDITWSPADFLSCTTCENPVATPTTTTTYTASGIYKGCPVSATAKVLIQTPPVIQFPGDLDICLGESITLNQVNEPSTTYNWTSTDPGFVPTNTAQPTITPSVSATYFVQANNGCTSQGQVTVSVSSATLTVSSDTSICQNFTAGLFASGSQPGTYEWTGGLTGQLIQVSPAETTTYTVTYTYGNNCTLTDQVTVNIQGVGPEIVFPADVELCPGESVVLNSTATPGATYSWVSNPPGFTSTSAQPADSPEQSTQYTVTANVGDCKITKTVNVIVYNATLTVPDDVTICGGSVVDITANGSLSGSYAWSSGDTTAQISVQPDNDTVYDLVYSFGDGCTLEESVKVSVKKGFTLKIVSDPDTNRINIGDQISLMGIVSPSQNLAGFQFQWLENGQTNVGTSDAVQVIPSVENTSDTISYILTATSPNGCSQQAQFKLTVVLPLVVVPNAFTPNADGVNDLFRLKIVEGSAVVNGMEVYNRWGKLVFSSSDPLPEWDGTLEGKEAPSDVYVYIIRWQRGDGALQPPLIGDITLLR